MARYFVEFRSVISVEAETEEEAVEQALQILRIEVYDDYTITKEG